MTTCPRCGTGVLPSASVCTACCLLLGETELPEFAAAPAGIAMTAPETADVAEPTPDPGPDPYAARATLNQWPFGGADAETVRAVAEAAAPEARPQLIEAANTAAGGLPGELRLPSQRAAAFHPMQISAAPPPPNPYLAAERRQQAGFGTAPIQPVPVEPRAE